MRQIEASLAENAPKIGLESMFLTPAICSFSNDRSRVKLLVSTTLARSNIEINEEFNVLTLLLKFAPAVMARAARL